MSRCVLNPVPGVWSKRIWQAWGSCPIDIVTFLPFQAVFFHLQAKHFQHIWNFLQECELQALPFLSLPCREGLTSAAPAWSGPTFLALSSPLPTVFLCTWIQVARSPRMVFLHRLFTESEPLHRLFAPCEMLLLLFSASWVATHPAEPLLGGHYLREAILIGAWLSPLRELITSPPHTTSVLVNI